MTPYYSDDLVTIYHGDCREILPHVSADVLVTDPPYGIAHRSGRSSHLWGRVDEEWADANVSGDQDLSVRDAVLSWWGGRPALVFGSWKTAAPATTRAVLVWDKGEASGMGDLSLPWKPSWESIYVLGRGFAGHRGGSVLRYYVPPRISMGRVHPTEKPASLLRALIQKCPAGVVLDTFMGAGSTLVAAKQLNRRAIGIEIEERYCEIAAQRLSQATLGLDVPA